MSWDGDHLAENKWVRSTRGPPFFLLSVTGQLYLNKDGKLKITRLVSKVVAALYPYQIYGRVLTDSRSSTWGLNSLFLALASI